jgi:hypothetical protein
MMLNARRLPWSRRVRTSLHGCRESKAVSAVQSKHFPTKSSKKFSRTILNAGLRGIRRKSVAESASDKNGMANEPRSV